MKSWSKNGWPRITMIQTRPFRSRTSRNTCALGKEIMKWKVVARPEGENDVLEAANWYDSQRAGLGDEFVEEVLAVFDALEVNPLLHCRRHPTKNIRWRYPERFPYRVIYEVIEKENLVVIAAVIHAPRHDRVWRRRVQVQNRER
jgi:mRNA-degrading endonuclease RelE of RelBE toxin-antitoxin system